MADQIITVTIDKLVNGGQGIGTLDTGQKAFVWNALPGETVTARIIKRKRAFVEAIAEVIQTPSPDRVAAQEHNYLATSPWQIMTFAAENNYKKQITLDVFAQEKIALPTVGPVVSDGREFGYRNKMEYSFWGDDDGLHLALYQRGSHGKQIVQGSQLALPAIDAAANAVLAVLQSHNVRAGDLKTLVLRSTQAGQTAAALFVKTRDFPLLALPSELQGLRMYYSNPKSPASVRTELLHDIGDCTLQDTLLREPFSYDVDSFFQVNIPVFEKTLAHIASQVNSADITDMYAGVGSIGLSVAQQAVTLVELDLPTAAMAGVNAATSSLQTEVIETSAEASLEYITADRPVIVDPPRAGLHKSVTDRLLTSLPPQIVYLSCNPATQARDLAQLQTAYDITFFEVYNYFPRTPHIESLVILQRQT